MTKIICYTAIFGRYDKLLLPEHRDLLSKEADFFCFTDNPNLKSDFYRVIIVERKFKDPTRENRYYKLLPHLVLPRDYEYSLYIDGNIILKTNSLINEFSIIFESPYTQIAMLAHPFRNCAYEEAIACIQLKKDDPLTINKQMATYKTSFYPEENGLVACTIIFCRFSSEVSKLCESWWAELERGSKRDQLSFNYVVWKAKFKGLKILPWEWEENHFYRKTNHINTLPENTFYMESKDLNLGYVPSRIKKPLPWVGHIPFAFYLVEKLRPSVIVELGTHTGNSFFSFCQAVKNVGLNSKVFAIDLWTGDPHAGFYNNEIYEDVHSYQQSQYPKIGYLIKKDFNEAVKDFIDESIDCLHIDGLHTYEAVKNDFETWLPKLKNDAIVLFHDTNVFREGFGVHQFWDELIEKYPYSFNFTHSNGLGVISVSINASSSSAVLINELKENTILINLLKGYGNHLFNTLPFYFQLEIEQIQLEIEQEKYQKLLKSKPIVYRNIVKRLLSKIKFW